MLIEAAGRLTSAIESRNYLAAQIDEWSRARLQRLIENEDVLVNGKIAKPSYKLRVHDEIEVELSVPGPVRFAPEDMPIDIVYEDDVLLVVNKPAGLVCHPTKGDVYSSLISRVRL